MIQSNINSVIGTVGGLSMANKKLPNQPNGAVESTNYQQLSSQQAYSEAMRREADALNTQIIHKQAALKRLQTLGKITPEKEKTRSEEIDKIKKRMQSRINAYTNIDKAVEEKIQALGGQSNG